MYVLDKIFLICLFSSVLFSCGSGSSDSPQKNSRGGNATPDIVLPINLKPISNAGLDKTANINDVIILDAGNSSDPENSALNYQWTLTSKPSNSLASINDPTSQTPAITIDAEGTYIAALTVNDGDKNSEIDFVIITTLRISPVTVTISPALESIGLKLITGEMAVAVDLLKNTDNNVVLGESNQTLVVADENDSVVYLGIVNSTTAKTTIINEKSTADSLLILFPMISYIISENPGRETEIINLISSLPETIFLANIIKSRIDNGVTSLVPMDSELQASAVTAIDAAIESINNLLGESSVASSKSTYLNNVSNKVAIQSSSPKQSGVIVTTTPIATVNSGSDIYQTHRVTVRNTYARYISAGIYQGKNRIVPQSGAVFTIGPKSVKKFEIDSYKFLDSPVEVRVFGPGFLTNGFDPGWSNQSVLVPTLQTVISKVALPVIKTIIGGSACASLFSNDTILVSVSTDTDVLNAIASADLSRTGLAVVKSYLTNISKGFVFGLVDCLAEPKASLGAMTKYTTPVFGQYLLLYNSLSASLTVGEAVLDVSNSNRNDWWVLSNKPGELPIISFAPLPVNGVPPVDVNYVGECRDVDGDTLIDGQQFWDYGDGAAIDTTRISGALEKTHRYERSGTYSVSLTCVDPDGASKQSTIQINIGQVQPTIQVSAQSLGRILTSNSATPVDLGVSVVGSAGDTIEITLKNIGAGDSQNPEYNLNISRISSSNNEFVILNQSSASIPAGGSATFSVQYFPNIEGETAGVITIISDDSQSPTFSFNVKGIGGIAGLCNGIWNPVTEVCIVRDYNTDGVLIRETTYGIYLQPDGNYELLINGYRKDFRLDASISFEQQYSVYRLADGGYQSVIELYVDPTLYTNTYGAFLQPDGRYASILLSQKLRNSSSTDDLGDVHTYWTVYSYNVRQLESGKYITCPAQQMQYYQKNNALPYTPIYDKVFSSFTINADDSCTYSIQYHKQYYYSPDVEIGQISFEGTEAVTSTRTSLGEWETYPIRRSVNYFKSGAISNTSDFSETGVPINTKSYNEAGGLVGERQHYASGSSEFYKIYYNSGALKMAAQWDENEVIISCVEYDEDGTVALYQFTCGSYY